ncbi:1350_t:CDS:2, partial [Ambispora leptoticha]
NMLQWVHCVKKIIASDLQIIHSKELIYRDLHSSNILQEHLHILEALDRGHYSTASDIYSFGIIM